MSNRKMWIHYFLPKRVYPKGILKDAFIFYRPSVNE